MELALLFALGAAIYLLPSFIGAEKRNRTAIFLLNIFLGWTLVGWVVALVWATTKDPLPAQGASPLAAVPPAAPVRAALPTDPAARLARLKDLRSRGLLSQDEYLAELDQL